MFRITKEGYDKIVRTLAGGFAIVFWGISVWFSSKGFNIAVPGVMWVGWILGLGITVIELVVNRGYTMRHPIIAIAGVLAYLYGIWTNVVGIAGFSGDKPQLIHYVIGVFLEVVPEPILLFAILGKDFVEKSVLDGFISKPPKKTMGFRNNLDDPKIRDIRPTISGIQSIRPTRNVRRFK